MSVGAESRTARPTGLAFVGAIGFLGGLSLAASRRPRDRVLGSLAGAAVLVASETAPVGARSRTRVRHCPTGS